MPTRWLRWAPRRLLYRRGVPTRSARDLAATVSNRLGFSGIVLLAALACDLVIIASAALDSTGPRGEDLWLLPGIVALSACALWGRRMPLPAGLVGSAVLVLSSFLIMASDTFSYSAVLEGITFAETVAGVELVYFAVLRLSPLVATAVTTLLALATVTATVVRAEMWVYGGSLAATIFAGGVLLLLAVVAAAVQRGPGLGRRQDSAFAVVLKRQWPLVSVLAVILFLETFYAAAARGFGVFVLLCSFGTAVVAVLASRIPAWSAVYYSVLVVMAGAVRWITGAGYTYADLYGMPVSQIVSGMVVVVLVVRHETPKRAAWLIALQSSAVALVTIANRPFMNFPAVRTLFVAALLVLGISVAVGMFLRARDSERAQVVASAVSDAQTTERMALARELHDVVAHHVTGIVVQAQAARMLAEQNPVVVVDALEQIERAGTDAMTAMRRLVRSMRGDAPSGTSEFSEQATTDLAADLRRLVETGNHGVPTRLDLDVPEDLPAEVARSALRIVQESLTNIGKHAEGATRADVSVRAVGAELHIRVADNGDGGAGRRHRAERPSEDSGYGLVGMRERVDLLRGQLRAGPSPDGGWLVEVAIPLASPGQHTPSLGEAGRKDAE
ncbi:sensor histidine kinase [Saccharomonospora xinjiangensis]|uniref:sensor histidine kinase n=1 Tax=Saccharomonospora xinjiangensis TaxID=75294 RepID=UPI00031A0D0B|nr:sensor histidine kinase [Saccharomonospora xinjiangensis]